MTMLSAGIINASSVIEDWEGSSPLSNWSGDSGFTVQQSTVYEGSTALESTDNLEVSITKDGVTVAPDDTPVSGYFWNGSNDREIGMVFAAQSTDPNGDLSCYETTLNYDGSFRLYRQTNGGEDTIASAFASNTTDGWTKLTVDWQSDGTISVTFTDTTGATTTISATDTDYSSGRIGVVSQNTNYADYLYYGT